GAVGQFVRIAGPAAGVSLDSLGQLRRNRRLAGGDAEVVSESAEFGVPQIEGSGAEQVERLPGDGVGDVRVAIAIAADPASVADERRDVGEVKWPVVAGTAGPHSAGGIADIAQQPRDRPPDGGGKEIEAVADLVGNLEAPGADIVGDEQELEEVAETVFKLGPLAGEEGLVAQAADAIGDLELLVQHAAPAGLGRVGGERGLDV